MFQATAITDFVLCLLELNQPSVRDIRISSRITEWLSRVFGFAVYNSTVELVLEEQVPPNEI